MINARLGRLVLMFGMMAGLGMSGCKSAPPVVKNADGSVTNADGSVTYPPGTKPPVVTVTKNPDGSITNPDGSVTYPAGSATAEKADDPIPVAATAPAPAPAPVAAPSHTSQPAPKPVQPASVPVERVAPRAASVVPAGTRVAVSLTETLAASKNDVGDRFSGVLAEPLTNSVGSVVFPRGTRVGGTVVAAKGRGRFKGAGALGIQLTSIEGLRVSTDEYEKEQAGKGKRTGALIGGGAGLGAIIGGLAGGGKGALIGGLAGAGAGTAGAAYTGNKDVVIPSESVIEFTLNEAVHK